MSQFTIPNEIGDRAPLGAPCRHCGSADTWVELRLAARPHGAYSLAGMQVKFAARPHPYAVCGGCGHTSRGERTS